MNQSIITINDLLNIGTVDSTYAIRLVRSMHGWHLLDKRTGHQVVVTDHLHISLETLRSKVGSDILEFDLLNELFDCIHIDMDKLIEFVVNSTVSLGLQNTWLSPNVRITMSDGGSEYQLEYKDVIHVINRKMDTNVRLVSKTFKDIQDILNVYLLESKNLQNKNGRLGAIVYDHILDIDDDLVDETTVDKIYEVLKPLLSNADLSKSETGDLTIRDITFSYCEDRLLKYNVSTMINALELYDNSSVGKLKEKINVSATIFVHGLIHIQYLGR